MIDVLLKYVRDEMTCNGFLSNEYKEPVYKNIIPTVIAFYN